nr:hypothetical protein GCM10020093_043290 [Planobispora longispora]
MLRREQPGEDPHQGGLARPVHADQADDVPGATTRSSPENRARSPCPAARSLATMVALMRERYRPRARTPNGFPGDTQAIFPTNRTVCGFFCRIHNQTKCPNDLRSSGTIVIKKRLDASFT